MILPQSYSAALILLFVALFLWGSWANTLKLVGRLRFELYYFDFAIGFLITSVVVAFTLGSLGFDGFSLMDDLSHAGKRQWFYVFVAGIIFNFANMLLTAGISVAGMAVSFPVSIGLSILVGSFIGLVTKRPDNGGLLAGGCLFILVSMILIALANSLATVQRHEALARAGKAKSTRRPGSAKGVVLAAVSGLLMSAYFPLIQRGMEGELGLGPYATVMIFGIGVFISTFVFNIFFMNLSVEGDPVEIADYFRARPVLHILGAMGGFMWAAAALCSLLALSTPGILRVGPAVQTWTRLGFPVIAALWGLVAWREFRGSDLRAKALACATILLFALGLTLVSIAPLYLHKA